MTLLDPAPPHSVNRARPLWPHLVAAMCFAGYLTVSLRQHWLIRTTGYDLGIFEQAVRAYADGRPPVVELKGPGFNLLGDHFHPILMLLAPLYRLFPTPETLLIAQAALVAVSIIPIGRTAVSILGPIGGTCVAVAYGLSWGLQELIGFDFHEVAFAVPLLAFSLERLLRRQWPAAVAWAVPLVLVKEDLPLTIAALGGYLVLQRQRRLGLWTMAFGLATTALVVLVALPLFNPAHHYAYSMQAGSGTPLFDRLATQAGTVIALLSVGVFVAVRSPVLLLAVPTLGWRFLADNPSYWGTGFHYNAVLMVIVFAAFLDAARSLGRHAPDATASRPSGRLGVVLAAGCLVACAVHAPGRPLRAVVDPSFWRRDPRVAAAHAILDRIPDDAEVAATNRLVPQLTGRARVRMFPPPGTASTAEWVVADTAVDDWPYRTAEVGAEVSTLGAAGYRTVAGSDGFVLLHRVHPDTTTR
ncbi:DUF2079 domain-containing protein [Actinoplanes sp. NPDC051475]|uniref:DUF2079 domain-containing protein n=1 Tax=Actinoplanes sp. NPDC051475 TaxID=3157225 RepID=UPI00344C67CB